MIKKKYQLAGLHCTSCSMVIEGELEDIGVAAACDYVKQEVVVEFDPEAVKDEEIVKTIERQGYKVVS